MTHHGTAARRFNASLITLGAILLLGGCFNSGGMPGGDSPDGGMLPNPIDFGIRDEQAFDDGAPDLTAPDLSAPDLGADGGTEPLGCEAQDVRPSACSGPACTDDGPPPGWYWDGSKCRMLGCGQDGGREEGCVGSDCDAVFATELLCEEAYATCNPAICRATGGSWRFWGECDCGFACGVNGNCRACEGPSCDCGPGANFIPGIGCMPDPGCTEGMPPQADLCTLTGGEWGTFCESSTCGVPSPLLCAASACNCPGPQEFDPVRGCIETERCYEGFGRCDFPGVRCPLGQSCAPDGFCRELFCTG